LALGYASLTELTSLIMPAKDAEHSIQTAVESVIHLSELTPVELIVINDGSQDATLSIVKDLLSNANHLKSMILANQYSIGPGLSRNQALNRVSGDTIGFLDADDRLLAEPYAELLDTFRSQQFDMAIFDDLNGVYDRERSPGLLEIKSKFKLLRNLEIDGSVIYSMFDKNFIENSDIKFGRYYFEDIQFQYGALAKTENIMLSNQGCYIKSKTEGSILNSFSERHIYGVIEVFNWMANVLKTLEPDLTNNSTFLSDVAYGARGLLYQVITQGTDTDTMIPASRLKEIIRAGLDKQTICTAFTDSKKDRYLKKLMALIDYEIV